MNNILNLYKRARVIAKLNEILGIAVQEYLTDNITTIELSPVLYGVELPYMPPGEANKQSIGMGNIKVLNSNVMAAAANLLGFNGGSVNHIHARAETTELFWGALDVDETTSTITLFDLRINGLRVDLESAEAKVYFDSSNQLTAEITDLDVTFPLPWNNPEFLLDYVVDWVVDQVVDNLPQGPVPSNSRRHDPGLSGHC